MRKNLTSERNSTKNKLREWGGDNIKVIIPENFSECI